MKTHNIFLLLILTSILGYSQKDTNTQVLDTSYFLTRYKLYPIESNTLYNIDKVQGEVHITNSINKHSELFYQGLSTEGSPHAQIGYSMSGISDFEYQPSIYPTKLFTKDNIKFYNVKKPFTELFYSNTLNSSKYFSVKHAQNIYKNLHIGLEYNVDYSTGSFDKSSTRNQFFNITSRYKDSLEVYEALFGLIRNRALQNESGGILSDSSYLSNEFSSQNAYPLLLNSASSKWKTFDVFLTQKYNFLKKHSNKEYLKGLALLYDLSYYSFTRVFSELEPNTYDTNYYSNTLTKDSLSSQTIENHLYIIDYKFNKIGLKHNYFIFQDSINQEKASVFTPYINLGIGDENLSFELFGDYNLSNSRYNNDFNYGFEVKINNKLSFSNPLIIKLEIQEKSVEHFFLNYFSNNHKWNNNFKKYDNLNVKLNYSIEINKNNSIIWGLDYYSMKNIIVLDEFLTPKQYNNRANLYQLFAKHKFSFGRFFLSGISNINYIDNEEAISLPVYQTKQRVGVNFQMFKKKLDTYIGFDFRYNTSFYSDAYSPSLGAFYNNDNREVGNYLYTDFFIQAKIQRVSLFVSLTHPYSGLFGYDYYYTPNYPQENLNFRFGISWRFFD
ncbi:MAG: hypothetical protein PHV83_04405 [Bacteroidales bacterium]|nr:hypothetical protein [Bacteroidales bacterium]